MLETLRRNVSRGHKDVAICEVGLVTLPEESAGPAPVPAVTARPDDDTLAAIEAAVPPQPRHLAYAMTGERERGGWWGQGRLADWSDAVEVVRSLADALAVEVVVSAADRAPWHPGRCARITLSDGTVVGHAGELHPKVVQAMGLPGRTVAGEIDLDVLTRASEPAVAAGSIWTHPVAHSDVALVVAADVTAGDVEATLRSGAGELLESLSLFDVYVGDQVDEGHKSLAYHLVFRAPDRTLKTHEVNQLRDRAVAAAAAATGAVLRST
jgi:phenylalanyl-tRNA synthetase beta chain